MKKEIIIINDPNYGGMFVKGKRTTFKFIRRMIKNGCPTAGIMVAYIFGDKHDRSSGVEIEEIRPRLEVHFKKCKNCTNFLNLLAKASSRGKA